MDRVVTDVFDSPAIPVLLGLGARGVPFSLEDGRVRIGSGVTDEELAILRVHRDDVRTWLATLDAGVLARRATFESQLKARGAFTAYLYKDDVPLVRGTCFSCGDGLPTADYGRCWRCRLAWRLANRLPVVPAEWVNAIGRARPRT